MLVALVDSWPPVSRFDEDLTIVSLPMILLIAAEDATVVTVVDAKVTALGNRDKSGATGNAPD